MYLAFILASSVVTFVLVACFLICDILSVNVYFFLRQVSLHLFQCNLYASNMYLERFLISSCVKFLYICSCSLFSSYMRYLECQCIVISSCVKFLYICFNVTCMLLICDILSVRVF